MLAIELALGHAVALHILCPGREDLDHQIRRAGQPFAGDDLLGSFMPKENDVRNDTAELAQNKTDGREDSPDRVLVDEVSNIDDDICSNLLMGEARCARQKKFSFDYLVAIAVFGHCFEINDSHERFDLCCHEKLRW